MSEPVIPHFRFAWRIFKSYPRVFILSMFALFASWVALEVAVIFLQRFGIVVWFLLHLAFFIFFAGLMAGFLRMASRATEHQAPELTDLTALLSRGPTLLLASSIYFLTVVGGLILLVVPGIYLAARYAFFGQGVATESASAVQSLRDAGAISAGNWWTLGLFLALILLLNLAGAAFLGVGLLVTFPVSLLAMADLHRSLHESAQ